MAGPCSFCSAECCKTYTITVTSFDVGRISENTGKRPEEFAVFHPVQLLSYDPDTVLQFDDGSEAILGIRSHPCIFLEKNLCSVYEHAPVSCRCYPHSVYGTLNTRFCPLLPSLLFRLRGPDKRISIAKKEFDDYKKIVKQWNEDPGKREECLGFLLNVSKSVYL